MEWSEKARRLHFTMARLNLLDARDLPRAWIDGLEWFDGDAGLKLAVMGCASGVGCTAQLIVRVPAGCEGAGRLVEEMWQTLEKARWRMYRTSPVCGECGDSLARQLGGDARRLAEQELISLFEFNKEVAAQGIESALNRAMRHSWG